MRWKRRPRPGEAAYSPPQANDSLQGTQYKSVHERKRQPGAGAQAFAWETIALPAFTPIGTGVHALSQRPHAFYYPPAYGFAGIITVGLPYIAGQYALQPLIDPYGSEPNA